MLVALVFAMAWACSVVNAQPQPNPQPPVVTNFVVMVTNVVVTNVMTTNTVVTVTNAVLTNSLALNPVVRVLPEWELETWKIILDKFIMGVGFFVLGWWATKRLEEHKSKVVFTTELNKTRLEKLAVVWGMLYECKNTAIEILECARKSDLSNGKYPTEMTQLLNNAEAANEKAENAIKQNSFWLGRKQTENVEKFRKKMAECWVGLSEYKTLDNFEAEISGLEQGIEDIHEQLLRGDLQSVSASRKSWFSWLRRS